MKPIDPIALSQELIRCPSVTPEDAGCIPLLRETLEGIGFKCHHLTFSEKGHADVENLYARFGTGGKNLCFAGHTDVVPTGNREDWSVNPFEAKIKNGVLIGRGASDMKTAIAAWAAACSRYIEKRAVSQPRTAARHGANAPGAKQNDFSLSLLITGDEEAIAINGTQKVLKWMEKKKEKLDACVVGEPTSGAKLGDTVKIGRRGSVTFYLTLHGVQGHAAYPQLAKNPVTDLVKILHALKSKPLDKGTAHFEPSNLEITTIDVGNPASNVIPAHARATMNVRFNDTYTSKSLIAHVGKIIKANTKLVYEIKTHITGESFITKPGPLSTLVSGAVKSVTGKAPKLSTEGGTSDARFIKNYCPIIELGVSNKTAHKVDEQVAVKDIETLSAIYEKIIEGYFA